MQEGLQETLRSLSDNLGAAEERLGKIADAVNASNTGLAWEAQGIIIITQLGGLQEEIDRLGQELQLNVTLNITLPRGNG